MKPEAEEWEGGRLALPRGRGFALGGQGSEDEVEGGLLNQVSWGTGSLLQESF